MNVPPPYVPSIQLGNHRDRSDPESKGEKHDNFKRRLDLGFRIYEIHKIDERSQSFTVDFRLFCSWNEKRFANVAGLSDGDPIDKNEIWVPYFDINRATHLELVDEGVALEDFKKGRIQWHARFRATVSHYVFLSRFPFDFQNLSIEIRIPRRADLSKIQDVNLNHKRSSGSNVVNKFHLDEWLVHQPSSQITKHENKPQFTIFIPVRRQPRFYILNVGLILFSMTSLVFGILFVDIGDFSSRYEMTIVLVLTAVAFKFSISASLPHVSYLTLMDRYFLLCFFMLFAVAIESVLAHYLLSIYSSEESGYDSISDFNAYFGYALAGFWGIVHICIAVWIRKWRKKLIKVMPSKTRMLQPVKDPKTQFVKAHGYL